MSRFEVARLLIIGALLTLLAVGLSYGQGLLTGHGGEAPSAAPPPAGDHTVTGGAHSGVGLPGGLHVGDHGQSTSPHTGDHTTSSSIHTGAGDHGQPAGQPVGHETQGATAHEQPRDLQVGHPAQPGDLHAGDHTAPGSAHTGAGGHGQPGGLTVGGHGQSSPLPTEDQTPPPHP